MVLKRAPLKCGWVVHITLQFVISAVYLLSTVVTIYSRYIIIVYMIIHSLLYIECDKTILVIIIRIPHGLQENKFPLILF